MDLGNYLWKRRQKRGRKGRRSTRQMIYVCRYDYYRTGELIKRSNRCPPLVDDVLTETKESEQKRVGNALIVDCLGTDRTLRREWKGGWSFLYMQPNSSHSVWHSANKMRGKAHLVSKAAEAISTRERLACGSFGG